MSLCTECTCVTYVYVFCFLCVIRVMEKFVKDYPQLINVPKDDGFTALHLAAINDNLDIVVLLASTVS